MAGGRPLKYKNKEELQQAIDKYFNETPDIEVTITGLAISLDMSRQDLINYGNREEFFDTIRRAKDKVELSYEKALRRNGRTGDIFALKNFGWTDKQEVEAKTENVNMTYEEYLKKVSDSNEY